MRAIGRRLGLPCLVLGLGVALGDTHADVVDLFASMTAALTEDPPNAAGFMKAFDRKLPEYDELNRDIKGLLLDSGVASSVDWVKDEGDEAKRSVDLDWFLELRSLQPGGPTRTRREIVHCELVKQGKHWRITSISPISIFKP